jgi:hypothetical protein
LLFLASCASAQETGERVDVTRTPFTSAHATLLDFELDGTLVADTDEPGAVRAQIEAQLLFTIGQLNGEQSVGQLGQLEISAITTTSIVVPAPAPDPAPDPTFAVSYHAKFPVAWGNVAVPEHYSFTLPAKMSPAGQTAFVTKYGTTCIDPAGGAVDPGTMFLFYRPHQAGCALAADDSVTFDANVTRSADNTLGKYPEYHRVWSDATFEVVATFSHEYAAPTVGDEGVLAYGDFVWRMHQYLGQLQPNDAKRSEPVGLSPAGTAAPSVRLAAELPDGRNVVIDVMLVGHALTDDGAAFDAWYDAVTPKADLVLYNGHAGLGANVRTLMGKGTFNPGQYLIWFANGCDTFAYVDRTLADRRARLNPDDPSGTKYMDTVTNVMAGYFGALVPTSISLIHAIVDSRDASHWPRTYEQIFQTIDPTQIVVVTGEEDNLLLPLPPAPNPGGVNGATTNGATDTPTSPDGRPLPRGGTAGDPSSGAPAGTSARSSDGCSVGRNAGGPSSSALGATGAAFGLLALRRRRSGGRRNVARDDRCTALAHAHPCVSDCDRDELPHARED